MVYKSSRGSLKLGWIMEFTSLLFKTMWGVIKFSKPIFKFNIQYPHLRYKLKNHIRLFWSGRAGIFSRR